MNPINPVKIIETLAHVLLLIVIILLVITGYGVTDYHIIEAITFGTLSKALSYQVHTNLIVPLIILLALHFYFILRKKYHKDR